MPTYKISQPRHTTTRTWILDDRELAEMFQALTWRASVNGLDFMRGYFRKHFDTAVVPATKDIRWWEFSAATDGTWVLRIDSFDPQDRRDCMAQAGS